MIKLSRVQNALMRSRGTLYRLNKKNEWEFKKLNKAITETFFFIHDALFLVYKQKIKRSDECPSVIFKNLADIVIENVNILSVISDDIKHNNFSSREKSILEFIIKTVQDLSLVLIECLKDFYTTDSSPELLYKSSLELSRDLSVKKPSEKTPVVEVDSSLVDTSSSSSSSSSSSPSISSQTSSEINENIPFKPIESKNEIVDEVGDDGGEVKNKEPDSGKPLNESNKNSERDSGKTLNPSSKPVIDGEKILREEVYNITDEEKDNKSDKTLKESGQKTAKKKEKEKENDNEDKK